MMAANFFSTIIAMKLCNEGKPKLFAFISSTSALDADHYVKLSEQQISIGENGITEDDDRAVELGLELAMAKRNGCLSSSSVRLEREVFGGSVIRPASYDTSSGA